MAVGSRLGRAPLVWLGSHNQAGDAAGAGAVFPSSAGPAAWPESGGGGGGGGEWPAPAAVGRKVY